MVFLDPGTWTLNPSTRINRSTHVDIRTTHVNELIGVEGGGLSRSSQDFSPEGHSTTLYGEEGGIPTPLPLYYIDRRRASEGLTIGDKHFSLSLPMAPSSGTQ